MEYFRSEIGRNATRSCLGLEQPLYPLDRSMGWMESITFCIPWMGLSWVMGLAIPSGFPLVAQVVVPVQPVVVPTPSQPPPLAPSNRPPRSPTFPTLNSQQFDKQLQRYLTYLAEVGRPDVLIVGSSRALQGVDPIALQRSLANRGETHLKVYNFGINGATAQVVDLLLRRLLIPDQLPRLIVWADGARAFNNGRIDHTYNKIIASPGYKQLMAGKRPLPPARAIDAEQLCLDVSSRPFMPSPRNLPGLFDADRPAGPANPASACDRPFRISIQPTAAIKSNPRSLTELQESAGFQPLSARFNPATYFRRYPKIAGRFDADYQDFSLTGRQSHAFQSVLKFARSHHIPVVFVNLPLTGVYLDGARSAYERQFRAYIQQQANLGTLTFYDLSQRWLTQHQYFMDPSHLNQEGAARVSAQLGKDLKVPLL